MKEELLRPIAWQALREWLASPNYKEKANFDVVWAATSLGQEVERRRQEHWQWWAGNEGEALAELVKGVQQAWLDYGWVRGEQEKLGRPRTTDYPRSTLIKAHRLYGNGVQGYRPNSTYRWAESILGERSRYGPVRVIVISETVYRELLEAAGEDVLEGLTRAQVAEMLDLPKTASDRFCRWLLKGREWCEVKTKRKGGTRESVLRRVER